MGKQSLSISLLLLAVASAAGSGGAVGASAATAGSGKSGVGTVPVLTSSPAESTWVSSFLSAVGAPKTPANTASITDWIAHEGPYGTQGENNPMNTTQHEPGSTSFDGLAVQNYPTATEGLTAIVVTLENGDYPDILAQLRAGNGLLNGAQANLLTWSGGGYSSV
jgi:hypothetical protein